MAPASSKWRAHGALLLAWAAALGACACVSKPALVSQSFTIDPPAPRAPAPAPGGALLSLARVSVAPVYGGVSLVYRVGDHAIERDPYASLAASPAGVLTAAIRGYLRNADFVRDVVSPGEGLPVAAAIDVSVPELCGDFENPAQPAAVLSLEFRVVAPATGTAAARELLVRAYTRSLPIPRRTAAAVAAGWNQALGEIMAEFLGDLKAVLTPPPG
jgi:hypothetical protein